MSLDYKIDVAWLPEQVWLQIKWFLNYTSGHQAKTVFLLSIDEAEEIINKDV
jgi:hypothetical protein